MKLFALRLSEFGRFSDAVAIEHMSGGLDLLVGPNEAGKSTLLHALQHALFTKHTANTRDLTALRPYRGGAPLVEVEFEAGGERWRLRKRFLTSRLAELTSLSAGTLSRGADAEAQLERLLAARGAAGRSLVWLQQGGALEPEAPDADGKGVLNSCIAREIAASAGGELARQVRARVQAMLAELVSPGRGQPKGRYLDARRCLLDAEARMVEARAEHARVVALLDRLSELSAMDEPARGDRLHQQCIERLAAAEQRFKEARERVAARDAARLAALQARADHVAAATAVETLETALKVLSRLEAEAAADLAATESLAHELAAAEGGRAAATEALETARHAHAEATAQSKAAEAAVQRRSIEDRLRRARAADDRVRALDAAMAGLPLDSQPVRDAERHEAAIAELAARLDAAAPVVSIAYAPGAAGAISVQGEAVAGDARLVADGPLVIEVAGIGRITVEPGTSGDRDDLRKQLSRLKADLAAILSAAGMPDVGALERAHDEARRLASDRAAALAELGAIAPEGLEQLAIACSALIAAGAPSDAEAPEPRAAARLVQQAAEAVREAEEAHQSAVGRWQEARHAAAALEARQSERGRRSAEVRATLPPLEERAAPRAALRLAAEAASTAFDDALRVVRSSEERAPDAAGSAAIEEAVAIARRELQRAEEEAAARGAERARIEGALEASRQEDVVTRLELGEAEAVRARAALASVEEEVAALRLLDAELAAEEERLRDTYLVPVSSRLGAYVELVFPGATVELGAAYGVEGLVRGLQREEVGRLSDGTREQIAVLVRLAYARLLADQGLAVPLLLDDALVYSDDDRIQRMHRALEAAASRHQVIVLSCREQAFAGLAANRLSLEPWRPDIDLRRAG